MPSIVKRATAFVRYLSRFFSFVYHSMRPAYQLATGKREKASIIFLAVKFVVARAFAVLNRVVHDRFLGDDTMIRVRGVTYFVGLEAREVSVFEEVYIDHDYDRRPDFVPQPGWIVVDVGANIGVFALQQALRGARVYAYEPNPDCCRRLSKAIVANRLDDRIDVFNVALGSSEGEGTLVVPLGWTTMGAIVATEPSSPDGATTIPITTLDHAVAALGVGTIDLLKIDTEGAEIDILQAGIQTLPLVKRMVVEYHSRDKLAQLRSILRENGFEEVLRVDADADAGIGLVYALRSGL